MNHLHLKIHPRPSIKTASTRPIFDDAVAFPPRDRARAVHRML